MKPLTAIVIGATGLVGSHLIHKLIQDQRYHKIIAFARRPLAIKHPKLNFVRTDFENLEEVRQQIQGDVLFSCLGTTLKKAGSKEKFYQVDYCYQYHFIQLAAQNGVEQLILISAPGAKASAHYSFYLKIKGQLDEAVKKMSFKKITFIRPSLLEGARPDKRIFENLGIQLGHLFWGHIPGLRKYRPIEGEQVALVMAQLPFDTKLAQYQSIELDELFQYSLNGLGVLNLSN